MGRKRPRRDDEQPTHQTPPLEEGDMPAAAAKPRRTGDRHTGTRHTITLSRELYEALGRLADANRRPLLWEARLALEKHLADAGLWPPSGGTGEPQS